MKEDTIIDVLLEQGWKEYMGGGNPDLGYIIRKFESPFKLDGAECRTNDCPPCIHCEISIWPAGNLVVGRHVQIEFSVTAEADDIWVDYKLYAMTPDEAIKKLTVVREMLQKAWDSAN